MTDAIAVLIWWLILQAMGWAALPLLFRLLRWLPDRGYSVAKPAGLLLGNYVLWLLGTLGWLRNTEGGLLVSFGLIALLGAWVYRRWDDGLRLRDWLRDHRWLVVAYELVFLIAFAAWAVFRAHNPDLSTTEKPMEFAFMNAIDRSQTFPPHDPWLSGFSISYYYFGYVMMSSMMKLSAVNSGVAFSLSNALWFALTAAGAFGVAANLVAASKRGTRRAVVGAGLLAALFVAVLGNFQGPLDVAHANGVGSAEFWRWLDILDINTPPDPKTPGEVRWPFCDGCSHPNPVRGIWWFWRASRVVHDYPLGSDRSNPAEHQELIDEFPFFSFLLGDMHPHVLALPYALMSLALAFNLYQMGGDLGEEPGGTKGTEGTEGTQGAGKKSTWRLWFWDAAPIAALYPIFLGALSFLNTWDFPIHVFIAALAWGLGRWLAARRTGAARTSAVWSDALIALVVCGLMGVIAYLPFYIGFRSQAAGLAPNIYNPTRLPQFFVMFGPFLLIGVAFIVVHLNRAIQARRLTGSRAVLGTLAGGVAIVIASAAMIALATVTVLKLNEYARSQSEDTFLINIYGLFLLIEFAFVLMWLIRAIRQRRLQTIGAVLGAFARGMAIAIIAAALLTGATVVVLRLSAPAYDKFQEWLTDSEKQGISLSQVVVERLGEFGVPLLLGVAMSAIVIILRGRTDDDRRTPGGEPALPFALLLFGVGALLAFAVEYVFLLDQFGTRMNTV
ncbi:MAG TPA: DUF2298 domain-containing protein, partial [Anaerolineae bacterium]|nr:DUF2298 domain-containing protein [Anaerolineae bacterium]